MECLETERLLQKIFPTKHTTTTSITGCHYHNISFAISEQGQLLTVDTALENLELNSQFLSGGVMQVVSYCSHDPAECNYYVRTSTNHVYQLSIDSR